LLTRFRVICIDDHCVTLAGVVINLTYIVILAIVQYMYLVYCSS